MLSLCGRHMGPCLHLLNPMRRRLVVLMLLLGTIGDAGCARRAIQRPALTTSRHSGVAAPATPTARPSQDEAFSRLDQQAQRLFRRLGRENPGAATTVEEPVGTAGIGRVADYATPMGGGSSTADSNSDVGSGQQAEASLDTSGIAGRVVDRGAAHPALMLAAALIVVAGVLVLSRGRRAA